MRSTTRSPSFRIGVWASHRHCLIRIFYGSECPFLAEDHRKRLGKMDNVGVRMEWRRSDAQPFGTARDGWIVDGLYIDAELIEKPVANPLAADRVTDHQWDNVTWIPKIRNTGRVEPMAHLRNTFPQTATFAGATLEMLDTCESARSHCGRQRCRR
jgi:hypothetical protein